jgi:putative DNA primase/helicase
VSTITSATKPVALAPCFETIPAELTAAHRWTLWRFTNVQGKWTKPPFTPTGTNASSTDPATWCPFEDVTVAYESGGFDGAGRALGDGYVAIDLDKCRNVQTGVIAAWAQAIVDEFPTYWEMSPSGNGLRGILRGVLPPRDAKVPDATGRKKGDIEIYDRGRYVTITGHHLPGTPPTVESAHAALDALLARTFPAPKAETNGNGHHAENGHTVNVDDAELIRRALSAVNGAKFTALWAGDASAYPSASEADAALALMLAFWTNRDAARMDRLFRASGLMRDKWTERHGAQTYGAITIEKAIALCRDGYTGRTARASSVAVSEGDINAAVFADDEAPISKSETVGAPYLSVTPAASFVTRYVAVAQERTDAPSAAHELAAVLVMSALAGPRVRLPLAYRADGVRLVLWGMNVVDSTSGRKTTVNEFAVDVVRQVLGDGAILPWKGSPEAFVQAFAARDGQAAVFARDEYTGLLASMKKGGYTSGLAQDFIRAYDGLPIVMARTAKMNRKTGQRVDDTDRVRDPYLVKLCAATRTSFITTATSDDVRDGLLARFVFTSGTAVERQARKMTPALEDAWRSVVAVAREFHERADELLRIELPDAILAEHWEIENRLKADALDAARPDEARPAMKRLSETVLKVAALLAIDRGAVVVESDDLVAAAALAERWKETTLAIIADIGRTRFQALSDDVLATIRKYPKGIMLSALYRAHRELRQHEFDEVLGALETQRFVERAEVTTGRPGRPPVIYTPVMAGTRT